MRVSHQSNPASEPTVIAQAKTKPKVIINFLVIHPQNSRYLSRTQSQTAASFSWLVTHKAGQRLIDGV